MIRVVQPAARRGVIARPKQNTSKIRTKSLRKFLDTETERQLLGMLKIKPEIESGWFSVVNQSVVVAPTNK